MVAQDLGREGAGSRAHRAPHHASGPRAGALAAHAASAFVNNSNIKIDLENAERNESHYHLDYNWHRNLCLTQHRY